MDTSRHDTLVVWVAVRPRTYLSGLDRAVLSIPQDHFVWIMPTLAADRIRAASAL